MTKLSTVKGAAGMEVTVYIQIIQNARVLILIISIIVFAILMTKLPTVKGAAGMEVTVCIQITQNARVLILGTLVIGIVMEM